MQALSRCLTVKSPLSATSTWVHGAAPHGGVPEKSVNCTTLTHFEHVVSDARRIAELAGDLRDFDKIGIRGGNCLALRYWVLIESNVTKAER